MQQQNTVFSRVLWQVGWRYLIRHPLQTGLMVLGITLGVAVVIAIDLANESASRAFDLSVDAIAGRATHQIVGGPGGLDEDIYAQLSADPAVDVDIAPVVTDYVSSPDLGDRPIQLLGVDPFSESPFRSYLGGEEVPLDQLVAFFTDPGAILISTGLADRYDLAQGDTITLIYSGQPVEATIVGLLQPDDSLSARTLESLILADVATAQEITGQVGRLTTIDLIVPEDDTGTLSTVRDALPEGAVLQTVEARSGSVEQMTQAFRTNLLALSLLALVVGLFLIYNTMTFSVVQRRPLFGTLRCLGVTRREVFGMVLVEALIVGVIGAVLGTGLGILMGQGAVRLVTQTINDLFFTVTVTGVQVPPISLAKGALLGIGATAAAAAAPAWEAASVPPRLALNRSGIEDKAQRIAAVTGIAGVIVTAVGVSTLLIPSRSLVVSFLGTFGVIIGFALLTPITMSVFMRLARPLTAAAFGALGRMAPRDVIKSLSRTSIAVAALMVAVSVTIGISVMVGSFRNTVIVWLEQTLVGDVYISVPGGPQTDPSSTIDPAVFPVLEAYPGVQHVDIVRSVDVDSPLGLVNVSAVTNNDQEAPRYYKDSLVPTEQIWGAMQSGQVVISEPFANRFQKGIGDTITLNTDRGPREFEVVATYFDYGSVQGTVVMAYDVYTDLYDDTRVTAVTLALSDSADPDDVTRGLQAELAGVQDLTIRSNQGLRQDVLVVFDQTFAITGALNILTTIVAFIGVLSALLALQLEKKRELGILRAVGLTEGQMWGLTLLETGLMGTVAGLLAMPTGYVLALILVFIINRRSFGWTLQMQVLPQPFITALIVAVAAALLAAIYPARRLTQMPTAEAIRFE
ncbi:MAG: FtsX-like permease family protein [Chloroflexi bacterium]|nr:FtsX-like permease family protein [Chloroflexota bacterium]